MSLTERNSVMRTVCFPRVSGDEPTRGNVAKRDRKFSPRERG